MKWFGIAAVAAALFLGATPASAWEVIVFPGSDPTGDPSARIGPNAPSMQNSFFPRFSPGGNTVSVLSGSIGGHVFGGIAANSGMSSDGNVVSITGGTIGTSASGGNVFGGWSYDNAVSGNHVEIGNALVRGIVFGGWRNGGTSVSDVSNNTVTINSGADMRGNIYGGYSQGQNGNISGNEIVIDGGSVSGTNSNNAIIAGGYSAILLNTVSGNSVTLNDGILNNARIYGGRGQVGSLITGNWIEINGGTINNGSIFGGQNINSGAVNLNRVDIAGGIINATIYGGHSSGGSAVTGNTVSISGGSVTGNIYGGYTNSGSATGNVVTLDGTASLGAGSNLFGGYVNSGSGDAFTGNTLNMNNAASVDTARNFQFVNFGFSGNANIGTLYTTPTGSGQPGVILNTNAYNINFGGLIAGTGNLTKTGTGTLVLTGAGTHSGGTTVSSGTLQIGDGGATGSIAGNILNNARVDFNRSNVVSYGGVISGTGSLTQSGAGTLVLTGANTHSGGTVVSGGILQIGNGGSTGSIVGNILNNANVTFSRSDAVTYKGRITGSGKVVQSGSGTLTLENTSNAFNGGTEIESGTLRIVDQYSLSLARYSSKSGYITFTGTTGTKVAALDIENPVALSNTFRTQSGAGSGNYVDLTSSPNSWIMSVSITDKGGAFYVAGGTAMNVTSNYLGLADNMADGQFNDLYVESGGTFNLVVGTGALFSSGIDGAGTLNLYSSSRTGALVQFLNSPGIHTFQMGTTNVTGTWDRAIVLDLGRSALTDSRVVFNNTNAFNLRGDGSYPSAYVMGDGIIQAGAGGINVSGQGGLIPWAAFSGGTILVPSTLTLRAPLVNLDNFGLLYMVNGPQSSLSTDGQGIPVSNNSLLNIDSGTVNMSRGTVFFVTTDGVPFTGGDYLVIHSSSGFAGVGDINTVLTPVIDGFEIPKDDNSPRGTYGFLLGGDPGASGQVTSGTNNVWFGHALNSLSVTWTGDGTDTAPTSGEWKSGEFFYSLQEDSATHVHARSFLTGDKVYISGANSFGIDLPESDPSNPASQKIVVSGLVVGQNVLGVDTHGGAYTIGGDGGITADISSAFGDYVISGELVQTGKLQKYGDSTLTFTNTGGNLFKEGIELHGGVVAFTRADQLGDGGSGIQFHGDATLRALNSVTLDNDVDIADGQIGSLGAASGAVFAYTGELTGSSLSTLDKVDAGVVRFGASGVTSAFEGAVTVSGGTLDIVGDYSNTAQFNVRNSGTLAGTGIIGAMLGKGIIESGGTLKPGGLDNTPLTVIGDLAFEAGGNFDVRVEYGGGNDQVIVTGGGIVSIDPAANLNVEVDYWSHPLGGSPSDRHTVIDAAGGVVDDTDAQFVLHTFGLPRGWKMGQGWNGDEYQIWFDGYDPNNGFGAVGFTHNQTEIGKTIDWFVVNRDPGIRHLIDRLSDSSLNDREVGRLLDQLHGDLTPNALFLALKEPWRHPFGRLRPGSLSGSTYAHDGAWAELVGRHESIDHDGNAHGSTINRSGIAIGVDHPLSSRSVIGMTFQYTHPRLHQKTGTVKAEDYELGLYNMTRLSDNLDLKAYLGYSRQHYDFGRTVSLPASPSGRYEAFHERLSGSASGHALAASVELVRPVQARRNIRLLPVVALDVEKARINGYRESAGQASLVYDAASMKRTMLRFGVDSEVDLKNGVYLKPKVQYAVQVGGQKHPSVDARFANSTLPGQPKADIWGSEIGRNYVNLGLGGGWKMDARGDKALYVDYDVKKYNRATSHAGMAGFMMMW